MLDWADAAPSSDDPLVRTASAAVTELLRPRWLSAWELWGSVFRALGGELADKAHKDRAEGKDESPATLIAACAELWMPRMAGRDRNAEGPGEPDNKKIGRAHV